MKKELKETCLAFVALALLASSAVAQKIPAAVAGKADPSSITGGIGLTRIDTVWYYTFNIAPELAFGKFGVGLDLTLNVSSKDHQIRKQDFDETYDYIRIIRYLRWGHKGDDVYARLGILDYARLGHGFVMYLYNNSPSYDDRRLGTEFDLNFGKYGFETVYSDFGREGVFGIRGSVRPLQYTSLASVPILGNLEIGATWAGDMRRNSRDTSFTLATRLPSNDGTLNVIGADIGLPLLRIPTVSSTLYFDYAKILTFGSGEALGLETNFSGLGLFDIFTKFERRWTTDYFMPNYFSTFYELERYQLSGTVFSSKAQMLNSLVSPGPGYFGDLTIGILGKLQIRGTYSKLDLQPTSGVLHLGTSTGSLIPIFVIDAGYDKKYIVDNKDVFTLDERSLLYASIGYKPYPFMIVSMLYTWTFVPVIDANGNTSYVAQKRIQPRVSIVFPL
jgi:hypothetical protein